MRKLKIMEHISLEGVILPRSFEFVSTKAMPSGVIFCTYKAAGALKTA